jgi:hypothetical protein
MVKHISKSQQQQQLKYGGRISLFSAVMLSPDKKDKCRQHYIQ